MLLINTEPPSVLTTISGDFIKETTHGYKMAEEISGKFYYAGSDKFLLYFTQQPVKQFFTFNNDTLILYYPEDKIAFKIKLNYPLFNIRNKLSFFLDKELNFTNLGFLFVNKASIADTSYTYWVPKNDKIGIKVIIIGKIENNISSIEIKDAQNQSTKVLYNKYIKFKSLFLPTDVKIIEFWKNDTITEHYRYQNLQFNSELPDSIRNFTIPKGTKIKTVIW